MKFSVLTWNIHGKRYITKTDFSKIRPVLEEEETDIICLQEAREARRHIPEIPQLASYAHVFPKRGYNQNAILSKLSIVREGDIEFPRFIELRMQNALWADVQVSSQILRVYNCHFALVGAGPASREQQLHYILDHAESHKGPVIVCGDFNTVIPRNGIGRKLVQLFHLEPESRMRVGGEFLAYDERYALQRVAERRGFREATDIHKATWRIYPFHWELFNLKLDWLLVRGVETPEVVMHPYISDHRAIRAQCILS